MEELKETKRYLNLVAVAEAYFNHSELTVESLKGDGSDRSIFRISPGTASMKAVVGVTHDNISENSDFFKVTEAFLQAGLRAPGILAVSSDKRAYLLQDLGYSTLAEKVTDWNIQKQDRKVLDAYKRVLDCLVRIQSELPPILGGFLDHRQMDMSTYKADLNYFKADFIDRFGFESVVNSSVVGEFRTILDEDLTRVDNSFFVYRDFQARNIMWLNNEPWFIDYQSAFLGPRYYDLASLLYGSKSGLGDKERDLLVRHYYSRVEPDLSIDFERFQRFFLLFVVLRRFRSLGTYGFLAGSKGKSSFFGNIAPTLKELSGLFLSQALLSPFVHLANMVDTMIEAWALNEDGFRSRLNQVYERRGINW